MSVGCIGLHRSLLIHSGHSAAESRWRQELADAYKRLQGEFPAPNDEQPDPDELRRQVENLVRDAAGVCDG
jgi:hypothetical protein